MSTHSSFDVEVECVRHFASDRSEGCVDTRSTSVLCREQLVSCLLIVDFRVELFCAVNGDKRPPRSCGKVSPLEHQRLHHVMCKVFPRASRTAHSSGWILLLQTLSNEYVLEISIFKYLYYPRILNNIVINSHCQNEIRMTKLMNTIRLHW